MKRFMKYYKEKKGITLVLIALMLAVLLFFLGMAVDISYMYHVKNQLQVAADAAALGGIALLDGGNDDSLDNLLQENARREAWKFACKNRATNQAVYLVTTGADCDNPPAGSSLNSSNNPNGDIVVGNWNRGRTVACPTTGTLEPFCPANGTTGLAINAIKAWPKMTGETGTPMPKARVFVGQVFRLIGINWSRMSAAASAIATMPPKVSSNILICLPGCSDGASFCSYPDNVCYFAAPRILETGKDVKVSEEMFAWTSGLLNPTGPGFDLNDIICKDFKQNMCRKKIYTTMGTAGADLKHLESVMYDPTYDAKNKELDGGGNVIAWWITIPVLGSGTETGCPPGEQGGWREATLDIIYYAKVRVIAICATGGKGCKDYDICDSYTDPVTGKKRNNVIVIDAMGCYDCETGGVPGSEPVLVK